MGKKNKQPYFSVGIQKKTRVIYLGDKRAEKANEFVANYKKLLEIVDEMTRAIALESLMKPRFCHMK